VDTPVVPHNQEKCHNCRRTTDRCGDLIRNPVIVENNTVIVSLDLCPRCMVLLYVPQCV